MHDTPDSQNSPARTELHESPGSAPSFNAEMRKLGVNFTLHGRRRWKQRAGDLGLTEEWMTAKRPSKRLRQLVRSSCPSHEITRVFKGTYLLASPRVIFVVAPPKTIITVLRVPNH